MNAGRDRLDLLVDGLTIGDMVKDMEVLETSTMVLFAKSGIDGGHCRLIRFVVRTDVLRMVCGQGLLGELACLDLRRIMSSSEMDFHNS